MNDITDDDIVEDVELDDVYQEDIVEETPEAAEAPPVMDKEEELARKNGWKPKEEYEGNPADHKTPKQFNDHARMIAKIKAQERDLENIKKYVELSKKQTQIEAMESAKRELEDAKELGDFDAYEQAAHRKAQAERELQQSTQDEYAETERIFMERNSDWLDPNNQAQVLEVVDIAKRVATDYPGRPALELMEIVERRMFDSHPEYRRTNPALDRPVVSGTNSAVNKSAATNIGNNRNFSALPQNLQREYESMRRSLEKNMKLEYTKEEYIQGLKDLGVI